MKISHGRLPAAGMRREFERQVMRHFFSVFLLWYLSKHESHGYGLIKTLKEEEGFGVITASQLYPALKEMTRQGLISQKKVLHGKRARKVYRITGTGREELARVRRRMQEKPLKRQFLKEMVG